MPQLQTYTFDLRCQYHWNVQVLTVRNGTSRIFKCSMVLEIQFFVIQKVVGTVFP